MKRILRSAAAALAAIAVGSWLGSVGRPVAAFTLLNGAACGPNQLIYKINPDFRNSGAGSAQDQINAISAGASEWYNQSATPVQFVYGGTTTTTTVSTDTENVIFVRHEQPQDRLAETYRWVVGGSECRFDIIYYDGWPWGINPGGGVYDIQGVAAHEFGHALGLGHSPDPNVVMYASSYLDYTGSRSLSHDDVDGAEWLNGWRFGNGYHLEGVSFFTYDDDAGGGRVPLYRLYRGSPEDHFLSADWNEVVSATSSGYTNEGVIGYVYTWQPSDHVPLYRLHRSGHHLSTKDENERASAMNDGWTLEGVTGYVLVNPSGGAHAINRWHNVRYGDHVHGF